MLELCDLINEFWLRMDNKNKEIITRFLPVPFMKIRPPVTALQPSTQGSNPTAGKERKVNAQPYSIRITVGQAFEPH